MTDTEKEKKPLVRAYPSCVRHCTALSRAGLGRKIVLGSFQDTAPLRAESGFFRGGGGCVWNQVFTFQILNDSSAESMRHSGLGRHFLKPAPQSAKRRSRGCCSFSCSRDETVVPVLSSPQVAPRCVYCTFQNVQYSEGTAALWSRDKMPHRTQTWHYNGAFNDQVFKRSSCERRTPCPYHRFFE